MEEAATDIGGGDTQSATLSPGCVLGLGKLIGLPAGVFARNVGVTLIVSSVAEDLPVDSPTVLNGPAGVDHPLLGGLLYNPEEHFQV